MSNTSWLPLSMLLLAACATGADEDDHLDEPEPQLLTQVSGFGSNPGNLQMFTHVPAGLPASAPLVLVLHGCSQSAAGMEASGWTAAANAHKFYLIYAQQTSANNGATCFNWFNVGDHTRDQGEALSLRQMVGWAQANASIDPGRVFVTGFSAGAFMAATMAAVYPDVFAAAAIMAGGPHGCAKTSNEAFSCMNPGVNKTPTAWGDLVRNAFPGYTGAYPRISIWHGLNDTTVRPANQIELVDQWTNVFGTDQTADLTETVAGGHTRKVYRDASGAAVVESYEIAGMGHAVPVDPQFTLPGGGACGSTGSFISDANICAVHQQELFFGLLAADNSPPAVQLTAPAAGATVSGSVALTATASDNAGVSRVEFLVDGMQVGSDTAAPYEVTWNSATVADGSHTVTARAVDTSGNATTSAAMITTSNGTTGTTVSFAGISAEDGYVKAFADGSSPAVGTLSTLAIGRGTDAKYNRAFLSFDTSPLPDGAVITSATVTVTYSSGSGSPWSNPAGNTLVLDVKSGTFGAPGTETTDWAAAASASAVATLAPFTSGSKTSSGFSAAGLGAINKTGRTQLRLRFSQNQTSTAYVFIGQGASTTLKLTYQ